MDSFRIAIEQQEQKIRDRAADLVRGGMSAWEAYRKASEQIRNERVDETFRRSAEEADRMIAMMNESLGQAVRGK